MENESQTENITDWFIFSLHIFDINDFWSYVSWRSTSHKEVLLAICKLSQPKISNHTLPAIF